MTFHQVTKPTLIDVLNNETSYPYSLDDFATFLDQTYCLENLEFWLAVRQYKYYSYNFYNSNSTSPDLLTPNSSTLSLPTSEIYYDDSSLRGDAPAHSEFLKQKLHEIITTYILPNSTREINIESSVREDLLTNVFSYNNYDPSILDVVSNQVFELMQGSSFAQFLVEAGNIELRFSSESESCQEDYSEPSSPGDQLFNKFRTNLSKSTRGKQKFGGLRLKEKYRKLLNPKSSSS
ncbi:35561_t:CDS:1 [Gigaspora margarita]|uniref:35561_t:CDS:1 n=2 Tax=Gigaspora margarita TaxID=4874 RepID=A0ABN7UMJ5_GIGMA|nr:regulator of G protein signaling superfamily [Gigaspora margarita]CAG8633684.1 35561_t:CDS:1 [Gigaspora margarita]